MSVYGKTKDIGERGLEIKEWLDNHKDVESFAILDDEDFDIAQYFPKNLVKTNTKIGLQKKDAEKCIAILSSEKGNKMFVECNKRSKKNKKKARWEF